ncbi:MAG: CIA30 family protein [Rhodospirillaceae bacterium]|nr:CIA30 family protein [Rhodospirillaceae bacterium]
MLIDDFSGEELFSPLGSKWRGVSDRVMGGISIAGVTRDVVDGQTCLRLAGDVLTENGGGFIQASLSFSTDGEHLDATDFAGIRLSVCGNGEMYSVHIRTPDCGRPWQSYRSQFQAQPAWETVTLPFTSFEPHRLESPLDQSRLTRMGLVAIGRPFRADLAVSEIAFYKM